MLRNGRFGLALACGLLVVLFQNCGDGGFAAKLASKAGGGITPTLTGSSATPTPVPTPTFTINSWEDSFPAAKRADDCLTNSAYNLCLPYKDPVTTNGAVFSPALGSANATTATDAKIFVYGLKVPTTGTLQNTNFRLDSGTFAQVTPVNGSYKFSYRTDSTHKNAQLSTWYLVNRERTYYTERAGVFHFSAEAVGSKLTIRPYRTGANFQDNAYFDQTDMSVNIGYISASGGDLALDHGVVAHEVGHANFFAANADTLNDRRAVGCFGGAAACCPNTQGCIYAIHEGVGDLHAMFLFPDKGGVLGAYWQNNVTGDNARNLDLANTRSASYYYGLHTGEIHDLGTVYASIWYGVWSKAKAAGAEKDIEVLFAEHLSGLGGNDSFVTAFTTIGAMADQMFPAKAAAIRTAFRAEYTRLGLTVP